MKEKGVTGYLRTQYLVDEVGNEGMESNDSFLEENRKGLPPEVELHHFKGVVKSLMQDASKALALLELEVSGAEAERLMELLDHYLIRLSCSRPTLKVSFEAVSNAGRQTCNEK
jgi:hypothetical protein